MKKFNNLLLPFAALVLFLTGTTGSSAQSYGNEWINYSQQYYKFPVASTGIYRISPAVLGAAGIPVNSLDPRNIQLFFRGQQVPIHIEGEGDGSFTGSDFIEFFGQKNDGWLDTALYLGSTSDQPNKGYSIFNDTSFYYLTWNNAINNLRLIPETDVSFNAFAPSQYYIYEALQPFTSAYYEGQIFAGGQLSPEYTMGEGYAQLESNAFTYLPAWNSGPFNGLKSTIFTGGPDARFNLNLVSCSDPIQGGDDHQHQVRLADAMVTDTTINGHGLYKRFYNTSAAALAGSANPFRVDFLNTFSNSTRNGICYFSMRIPQTFNLGNRTQQFIYLPDAPSQSKARLSITSFNNLGSTAWIYDLTNRKRVTVVNNAGTFQALLPNSGGEKKCYIASEATFQQIATLQPVSADPSHYAQFRDFRTQWKDFNYIVISCRQLWDAANVYKNYRNQTGFTSVLIDIDELYDQFAYGVRTHPVSIRNFLRLANFYWNVKPEHVFMIGKGIKHNIVRTNAGLYGASLLPTAGIPSSDNIYTFNLDGSLRQTIAIGRLAAKTEQEVYDYYDKMREHEGNLPAEWMKHVLHLGGGGSALEQGLLKQFLREYQDIIEDSLFGARVDTFFKTSSQPLQITQREMIKQIINEQGVSIITIFGHGSGQGFDQNVDEPENYDNKGKYPLVIANSCLTGDIFQATPLLSERFVLAPQKAAIGFIAATSQAISTILKFYTDTLYTNIALRNYGEPIGTAAKNSVTSNSMNFGYNDLIRITAIDMQVHGDPALRLSAQKLPDIMLSEQNVSFLPVNVTSEEDTFTMQIIVTNLGRTIGGSYNLTVTRNFPATGKPDTTYYYNPTGLYFKDSLRIKLPTDIVNSSGENIFTIKADPLNAISEFNEFNNEVSVKLNISSSEIIPVYPFDFQVVPSNSLTLKASTGNPFAPLKSYKIQIDTTDLFNSPFLRDTVATQTGGVVRFTPPFLFTDSTVYFWRAGVDSANTGIFTNWKEHSFQYITGKSGWGQDHFFQFKKDDYLYINDNRNNRLFEFVPNFKSVSATTVPCNSDGVNFATRWQIDGVVQEESGCSGNSAIIIAVVDPITLQPWETNYAGLNPTHDFGNQLCRNRPEKYFMFFLNDPVQRAGLENMLNVIPNDHYILAYTWWQGTFNNASQWPQSLINSFGAIGADTIQTLVDSAWSRPFIYFGKKGNPSTYQQVVGTDNCDAISLDAIMQNEWPYGTITSPVIGPAVSWGSFHWQAYSVDNDATNDTARVNIIGIKNSGQQDVLFQDIPINTTDIFNLQSTIDASVYPYLKLFLYTRDDSTQTPSQLDRWHVLYEGVPEAALNPSAHLVFESDTLSQGQQLLFSTAIENIGAYDMDSLLIRYFIVDNNNGIHDYFVKKDSLRIGETVTDTFRVQTNNYAGINSLWIEANPLNHPQHQPEQFHFNNIGQRVFFVGRDNINPLLDVTFDGVHIMDGDIVSAKPEIAIQLQDENTLLALDDTSDFELYLRKPGQAEPSQIYFSGSEVEFIPATLPDNLARIEYRPDLTAQDGIYELLVRAKDRSDNISGTGNGAYDYAIKFEIVNKSTITEVLNYPNPFSTSTQFVFTLTGSEIPSEFTIQILTISGVVVREITLNELGSIHIGRNITDYRWDGRDEFGDQLATGVYIYRVITKINGESIEKRTTGIEKYFREGFGKMYLMR